jgi:hypothetical protein
MISNKKGRIKRRNKTILGKRSKIKYENNKKFKLN